MIVRSKSPKPVRKKPAAAKVARPRKPEPSGDRAALIKRMWRAADAQVQEIENRLLQESQAPLERERDARVLAVLAKTLRELAALDETKQRKQTAAPAHDDAVPRELQRELPKEFPRDLDELRRSLAQKLEALVSDETAAVPDEP